MPRVKAKQGSRNDWETPAMLFDPLHERYSFTLDAAASKNNARLPNFIDKEADALSCSWDGRVFLNNPGFGGWRTNVKWLVKAYEEVLYGPADFVVAIVPASVGARWWNKTVRQLAKDVVILIGRPRFELGGIPSDSPTTDICIAVYRSGRRTPMRWWDWKRGEVYPR